MSKSAPKCRTLIVYAFRGDRTRAFATAFQKALDDERNGRGGGPTALECLIFAGHTGVSVDEGKTIYGFHPDGASLAVWQLMDALKNGKAFPGVVRDDTVVFATASARGLTVASFAVVLPDPQFQSVKGNLDLERKRSQYLYGFPNGDGDCNCTTWLERMGLPLLTGRMDEFVALWGVATCAPRRFGKCV